MEYLVLKKSNCRNCHKCIRNCPVKSIRFSGNQAYINATECILCGTCFVVCPQNAKQIVNEIDRVKELIASGDPVYVSLAPSFIANWDGVGIEAMREALQKLGFHDVEETAIGATLVKREYEKMLENETRDVIITSCCNSVNLLIQKYYPSLLGNLADVLSPMQAHCKLIRERDPKAKTVFIGPCLSKMQEADHYSGYVDAVINFDQLSAWLREEGIVPRKEIIFNDESRARFFPTPGGVLKTMDLKNKNYAYMAVDGLENCIATLEDIRSNSVHRCFIEMNACSGACIGGPIMEKFKKTPAQDYIAVSRYAGEKDFPVQQPESAFMRKHFDIPTRSSIMPTEEQISKVLRQMGKNSKKDELNCGSCGYDSCREKAIAVCQGKAEINMCLPYLMSRTESFSDTVVQNMPTGLIVLNENLEIQQINKVITEMFGLDSIHDVMGEDVSRLIDPADLIEVLATGRGIREKKVHLEEINRYVSETILYDHTYHILICILRDITRETQNHIRKEKQSKETAEVADRVITNQMRIVQEIACLLGETAAETKVALSKLKESIKDE